MTPMTSHERFSRMFRHEEADRVPVVDGPWGTTIARWRREGMPEDVSYVDFFDLDKTAAVGADNSPRYETRTIEETDEYRIYTTCWGATLRQWTHAASTPEFLDFTIVDRDSWEKAKARMTPDRDRIDWATLERDYARWREEGRWITAGFWFGFDVTHSWAVGTERILMALVEDPEWCMDMFNHFLDVDIALFEQVLDAGYAFDCIRWPDDMGYKGRTFFSPDMYRELLKPVHARAVEWAHSKGVYAEMHSCGDVRAFVPDFIEMGLDGLNPLEVKAGMDPVALKKQYGDDLVLHGGVNAALWTDPEKIEAEMRAVVPELKRGGGYVFSSDHSVPDAVSLEQFRRIVELAKELGAYD